MKRFVLAIGAVVAMVASGYAMDLKEAFKAISNVQNVKKHTDLDLSSIKADSLKRDGMEVAAAANLDAKQIRETGNAVFTILDQVPMTYMVNGSNNGLRCLLIYASPVPGSLTTVTGEAVEYDVLVVGMSGKYGDVVAMLSTISGEAVEAYRAATLVANDTNITITPTPGLGVSDINLY